MTDKKRRISMKDHRLLLQSKTVEDYPWLHNLLSEHEVITEELIQTLPVKQQGFMVRMLESVTTQAFSEWKGDPESFDELDTESQSCSLCHQPTRYIYYVSNQLTGESINVGSTCIEQFLDPDQRRDVERTREERIKLKRLTELDARFPNIRTILESWSRELEKCEILIPKHLTRPYEELGKQIRELKHRYLTSPKRPSQETFDAFAVLLEKRSKMLRGFEQYVKDNSGNRYAPRKQIVDWLKGRGRGNVVDMLAEDGTITRRTLDWIDHLEFMESLIPNLNQALADVGAKIEKAEVINGIGGYVIVPRAKDSVRLFCNHRYLAPVCGKVLFDQSGTSPLSLNTIIRLSRIYDEHSVDIIVGRLVTSLRGSGVEIKGHTMELDEILLLEDDASYIMGKLEQFVEQFKVLAFKLKEVTISDVTINNVAKYVRRLPARRLTREDVQELNKPPRQYRI